MDSETTVGILRDRMRAFVAAREWEIFHSPKNLAMSLAIEAAELMEHFQWLTPDESRRASDDPGARQEIADEMADVMCYLLGLANVMDIDLATAVESKMKRNEQKYPAAQYRGKFRTDGSGSA